MTARRFISWPSMIPEIRRQDRQFLHVSREAETDGGIDETASLRVLSKRSYSSAYTIPVDQSDWLRKWRWLSGTLRGKNSRLWYLEGSLRSLYGVRCGPPADGTRDTFPIPLDSDSLSDGPYLYVNGVWDTAVSTSYGTSSESANVLTDNQAVADTDLTGIGVLGPCTHQRTTAYRYYDGAALQVDPTATVANHGFELDLRPCLPSWPLTSIFWATGPTPLVVEARIEFFDSLQVSLGVVAAGTQVALVPGVWVPAYYTLTSPANAAYVQVSGRCVTTTAESWWCDCRGGIQLSDPWWWIPSDSPLVGMLSSAPASGSVVTAGGTGLWFALCRMLSDDVPETEVPGGHLMVDLDLREVWEGDEKW